MTKETNMNYAKNMNNRLSLLLVLFCGFSMVAQHAFGAERMRIIVDTDILNEMDDQHALAYTLFNSHVFEVEGVTTNSKHQWEVEPFAREARLIVHLCASTVPVHVGAWQIYNNIRGNIRNPTHDGYRAVNFIIERAHAKDPGGRPLYVMTLGKTTNLALALLKDPTIAPKIKVVMLATNWPDWTAPESNHNDDMAAFRGITDSPLMECHVVPWPRVPNPSMQDIYDIMPGLGPKVDPIVYNDGKPNRTHEGHTFTCWGDYSVALFKNLEHALTTRWNRTRDQALAARRILLDVGAPMVLKDPSIATSVTIGAPYWDGPQADKPGGQGLPGEWIQRPDNPRRVTYHYTLHNNRDRVMAEFWNTFRNPVIESPPPSGGTP
jgi:purine nucleosidase